MKAFFEARAKIRARIPVVNLLSQMLNRTRQMMASPVYLVRSVDEVLKNLHSVQIVNHANGNSRHNYEIQVTYTDASKPMGSAYTLDRLTRESNQTQTLTLPMGQSREVANKAAEMIAQASNAVVPMNGYLFLAVNPAKLTKVTKPDDMHLEIQIGIRKLSVEDEGQAIESTFSALVEMLIASEADPAAKQKTNHTIHRAQHGTLTPR